MRKVLLALAAMAVVVSSCVRNDPYIEPKGSEFYGKLFINEVNGTGGPSQLDAEKYVEFYNKTDADINLKGFVLDYGGKTTWTGKDGDVVPAHGYKLLKGSKNSGDMSQGLSSRNANVNLTLFDTGGAVVDYYEKVEDLNGTPLEQMDHMRIPDAGKWYFVEISAQSPGAANLTDPNDPAVKGEMPSMEKKLTVESVTVTPSAPTPDDAVVFLAKVTDVNVINSVVLKWTLNGTVQTDITMNKNANGLYEATIAKQADGAVAEWTVLATNNKGNTANATGTVKWIAPVVGVDYTKLKINEVSGVGADSEKFYELINTGTVDINLLGCKIYYNANSATGGTVPTGDGNLTWTGLNTQIAQAGSLFSLIGRDNPAGTSPGSFTTGLTAARILVITLKDPDGNVLDQCIRAEDTGAYAFTDKSFSRIPDGTGSFYFTTPTPNVMNGTDATGLTLVPVTQTPTPDYTKLVLNEIDGISKSIELYNTGTVALSLTGVTLWKNIDTPPSGTAWWTGTVESGSIVANSYVVIYQTGQNPGGSDVAGFVGASGISPKQTLKFELLDPNGQSLGVFVRGVSPWGTGISDVTPNSYQRIPNGTGNWQQAAATVGSVNAATGTAIPQN